MNDFNAGIIEEFRANHGKVGGNFDGAPVVLLTTTGAKSGQRRTNPLATLSEDGDADLRVCLEGRGAHESRLVLATWWPIPEVEVEYGDEKFPAVAHVVTGDRAVTGSSPRRRSRCPGSRTTEKGTSRVIPVVELRRNNLTAGALDRSG